MRFEYTVPGEEDVTIVETATDDLVESVDNLIEFLGVKDALRLRWLVEFSQAVMGTKR